jgi:hypothetical protein
MYLCIEHLHILVKGFRSKIASEPFFFTYNPQTSHSGSSIEQPLSNSYRQTHAQLNPLIRTYREFILFLLVQPLDLCVA